ncbi:hypothetical protein GCM10018789_11510 [Streptomyces werraensis]|nr:hypothetical protein GCM10018789_11510 [Streptomyces werraensis]
MGEPDVEVPAGDMPVPDGVGGQLGGDQREGFVDPAPVRVPPGVEPVRDQSAGQAGAARGGGDAIANSCRGWAVSDSPSGVCTRGVEIRLFMWPTLPVRS